MYQPVLSEVNPVRRDGVSLPAYVEPRALVVPSRYHEAGSLEQGHESGRLGSLWKRRFGPLTITCLLCSLCYVAVYLLGVFGHVRDNDITARDIQRRPPGFGP